MKHLNKSQKIAGLITLVIVAVLVVNEILNPSNFVL